MKEKHAPFKALPLKLSPQFSAVQFSSVTQSCPTLCNPMNRSTPGPSVHHQLPKFTQTYAHRVGDAIQPSHSLSSPSPPAPNPSQLQGLFQYGTKERPCDSKEIELLNSILSSQFLVIFP